jgi:hypothetical protein
MFSFKLERTDGSPADPPSFEPAVPNSRPGDTIPLGPDWMLRVVGIGVSREDEPSVLIVEDMAEGASGDAA